MTKTKGYLKITNSGLVDIGAFSLIGASTKRGNNTKIGFFGSGLKYAIATLLREEIPIKVYSGDKEVKISTKKTSFFIELTPQMHDVLKNWNEYFSDKRTDLVHSTDTVKFFTGGEKTIIYRKGIQVFRREKTSLFHYDCDKLKINESRVVESDWEINHGVAQQFVRNATVEMIEKFFNEYTGKIEEDFYFQYLCYDFSDNWLTAINDRYLVSKEYAGYYVEDIIGLKTIILPQKLVDTLSKRFGDKVKIVGNISDGLALKEPNEKETKYIKDACGFLSKAGIEINHNIKITNFDNKYTLGRAQDNQIILSQKLFTLGKKMIVSVILEEESHLDSGLGDNTRDFQNYLFSKIVTLMEEKVGITL